MKKCSNCSYCLIVDYGYSNYTVEGSDVYCSLGLNPDAPFDRWYGEDKRDTFASTCPKFDETEGPVLIDVERDDLVRTKEKGSYYLEPVKGPDKWKNYETKFVSRHAIEKFVE